MTSALAKVLAVPTEVAPAPTPLACSDVLELRGMAPAPCCPGCHQLAPDLLPQVVVDDEAHAVCCLVAVVLEQTA